MDTFMDRYEGLAFGLVYTLAAVVIVLDWVVW